MSDVHVSERAEAGGGLRAGGVGARGLGEWIWLLAACAAVAAFYGWTVWSTAEPWRFGRQQGDYYNLLIDGWLEGQLHMKVDVPEALLRLEDPYDPRQRPPGVGLHDASFYKGKYYVYFGAAPVVMLMLPFRLVTGMEMPLALAVLVFVYGGFLASMAVWWSVRRHYFSDTPAWTIGAVVVVLGLGALGTLLLRRPHMWELPIAAGYCFAMLALGALWRSLHATGARGRVGWLAGAAACLGLAVASRPTYLFALPLFAVPLGAWWWSERRLPWRELGGAALPLLAIGGAMAWHNYARFESPLQFGQAYQLSLDYESKLPHFGASYVPYNVQQHFFGAARWMRYFPFIAPPEVAPAPAGYTVHRGDVYGVMTNMPVAWLALLAPLALWRRTNEERRRLGVWLGAAAAMWVALAGVMLAFFSALARYQVDFAPTLMLLACVGLVAVARWLEAQPRRVVVIWANAAIGAVAAWSGVFAMLYSLQFDGLLREQNPRLMDAVARRLNWVPAVLERVAGVEHGPVEIVLRLSEGRREGEEMLLRCVAGRMEDRVFVRYEDGGRVRIGMQHANAPARLSAPLSLGAGELHRVRVTMGSLYPPATHPYFRAMSEEEARRLRRGVSVAVDGVIVVEGYYRFASGGTLRVGREAGFSGVIEAVRRVEVRPAERAPVAGADAGSGDTLRMRVRWPRGRSGAREPLVVTGQTGAGDFLYVEYVDDGAVRFGFDHWGGEGIVSDVVPVNFAEEHVIDVTMASLATVPDAMQTESVRRGRLRVSVNGRAVLERETEFFVAEEGEISVGANPIGGTSCAAAFSGQVLSRARVARE